MKLSKYLDYFSRIKKCSFIYVFVIFCPSLHVWAGQNIIDIARFCNSLGVSTNISSPVVQSGGFCKNVSVSNLNIRMDFLYSISNELCIERDPISDYVSFITNNICVTNISVSMNMLTESAEATILDAGDSALAIADLACMSCMHSNSSAMDSLESIRVSQIGIGDIFICSMDSILTSAWFVRGGVAVAISGNANVIPFARALDEIISECANGATNGVPLDVEEAARRVNARKTQNE